jgi:hypothetical protein
MRDAALNPKPKYFQTTVDTVLDSEAYACLPFNDLMSCCAVCN